MYRQPEQRGDGYLTHQSLATATEPAWCGGSWFSARTLCTSANERLASRMGRAPEKNSKTHTNFSQNATATALLQDCLVSSQTGRECELEREGERERAIAQDCDESCNYFCQSQVTEVGSLFPSLIWVNGEGAHRGRKEEKKRGILSDR